jgi:hypothetical protein
VGFVSLASSGTGHCLCGPKLVTARGACGTIVLNGMGPISKLIKP